MGVKNKKAARRQSKSDRQVTMPVDEMAEHSVVAVPPEPDFRSMSTPRCFEITPTDIDEANEMSERLKNFACKSILENMVKSGIRKNKKGKWEIHGVPPQPQLSRIRIVIGKFVCNILFHNDKFPLKFREDIETKTEIVKYEKESEPITIVRQDILYKNAFYWMTLLFTSFLADILPSKDSYRDSRIEAVKKITYMCKISEQHSTIFERYYCMTPPPKKGYYYYDKPKPVYFPETKDNEFLRPFGKDTFPQILRKLLVNEIKQRVFHSRSYTRSYREFYRRFCVSLTNSVLPKDAMELSNRRCKEFRKYDSKPYIRYVPRNYPFFFMKGLAHSNIYTNNRDWDGKEEFQYEYFFEDDNSDIVTLTKKSMIHFRIFLTYIFMKYLDYDTLMKLVLKFH